MSQHTRNSQSKKKQTLPKRRLTRPSSNRVQKKTKKIAPSPSTNVRPKRLSGLTAATLLQYCTNVLSPRSNERTKATTTPKKRQSNDCLSPPTKKAKLKSTKEENEPPSSSPPVRTRREASSRASALILQQNEIERSRFHFSVAQESNSRRLRRSKSPVPTIPQLVRTPVPEPFQFNIPAPPPLPPPPVPAPSITNISNQTESAQSSKSNTLTLTKNVSSIHSKYPPLTEALLAEHNRLLGTIPSYHLSKRENLLKWTQELEEFDHSSPPSPTWDKKEVAAMPFHRSSSFSFEQLHRPTFLPPSTSSSTFPMDFPSFYPHPLLPCWQYPAWPLPAPLIHTFPTSTVPSIKAKKSSETKSEPLTLHLHTHHHHHHIHKSSTSVVPSSTLLIIPSKNDELVQKKTLEPFHLEHGTEKKEVRRSSRSRGRRTVSSSTVPLRTKSTTDRKRAHSSTNVVQDQQQRKKSKISNHWILCGRFERKLVNIQSDQTPVYRKCFSSIRHVEENEIIRSNDCVILRPADATRRSGVATPYLAKVRCFWEEPISGEILMSLMWFYHPEHTELSARVKDQFLPNELLASKYSDCINVACIEDKCYVLTLNEYNRYRLREQPIEFFHHSENVQQLKHLLNKNTPNIHHRALPAKSVDNQNVFFSRYVYDYRAKRLVKNPSDANSVVQV